MNLPDIASLLLLVLSSLAATDETAQPTQDTKTAIQPRQRWSTEIDRKALFGHWRLFDQSVGFSSSEEKIIVPLTSVGAELKIDAKGFRIVGTDVSGQRTNAMNKIEFLPERFWSNTDEPRLRLSVADGTNVELIDVVEKDRVSFRYPANSCSRSSVRFSFARVDPNPTPSPSWQRK